MVGSGGVAMETVGVSVVDNSTELRLPRYVVLVPELVAAAERFLCPVDLRGGFVLLFLPIPYQ